MLCRVCNKSVPVVKESGSPAAHMRKGGTPCPGGNAGKPLSSHESPQIASGARTTGKRKTPRFKTRQRKPSQAETRRLQSQLQDARRLMADVARDLTFLEDQISGLGEHEITQAEFAWWRHQVVGELRRVEQLTSEFATPRLHWEVRRASEASRAVQDRIRRFPVKGLPERSTRRDQAASAEPRHVHHGALMPPRQLRFLPAGPESDDYYMDPTNSK